jgi:ABC-2 type transport system permease protein
MVNVISGGSAALRSFVVVGSALWAFVASGVVGLGQSILNDRERYRMLRYLYVSPSNFLVVIIGRGVARVAGGSWARSSRWSSGSHSSAWRSIWHR